MKSYDETIDTVFRRMGEYETAKKRRRTLILRTATPLCCFCLLALVWFGVKNPSSPATIPPVISSHPTLSSEPIFTADLTLDILQVPTTQPAVTEPTEEQNDVCKFLCYVNPIKEVIPTSPLYRDPAQHYTENWDHARMAEHLGVDLSSLTCFWTTEVQQTGNHIHTVTYQNDGTLVVDRAIFGYQIQGAEVTIMASKLTTPYDCIYTLREELITHFGTEYGSVSVRISGLSDIQTQTQRELQPLLVADFERNGVFYRVKAENMSVVHFYHLINTIINL